MRLMKLPEELQFIQNSLLPQKTTQARMDGKVCVVTGATSGIGYEAARRLSQGGAHVVMLCRNRQKALKVQEELKLEFDGSAYIFIADFQNLAEVRSAALEIREHYPRIDVLINNAGVYNKRRRLTDDGHEMTLAVIHLASFLLTRLLINNLQNAAPSRVLFISSEAHRFGGMKVSDLNWNRRPYVGLLAYGASKIAQIHTALLMAERYKEDGVMINLMHPGAVRTNIGMNNSFFYRLYKKYILRWFLKDPAHSAESIYTLVADPGFENVTDKYFNLTIEEKPAWYAVKPEVRSLVWEQSDALIRPYLKEER